MTQAKGLGFLAHTSGLHVKTFKYYNFVGLLPLLAPRDKGPPREILVEGGDDCRVVMHHMTDVPPSQPSNGELNRSWVEAVWL